jgi:hypothetical protein
MKRAGTETARALFYRGVDLAQQAALRSIIHNASIDCAEIFARTLNARRRPTRPREQLVLTLRNRERYKGRSGAPLGAPPNSQLPPIGHHLPIHVNVVKGTSSE